MKVLVERLGESPQDLTLEIPPEWWDEVAAGMLESGQGADSSVEIEARAHRMGEDLFLEGEVRGGFPHVCGRCLTRYRHPLRERFRLVLEPAGDRVPAEPEAALALARDGVALSDELEAGWFRGPQIDLGTFFREVIALGLPVQPVCREECRGLCPRCGVDRNAESCECDERARTSPFAVLETLRSGAKQGDS